MWSNRRLVELFKIEHPIVLAPMAGLGTVDLAAAVSNAGGIGSIGCAALTPELIAKTVAELRRLTTKPIYLNFFISSVHLFGARRVESDATAMRNLVNNNEQ